MKMQLPLPMDDCLHHLKNVHRVECGIIFASYLLSKPDELHKGDQARIIGGLKTAHGLLEIMAPTAPEEMKPAVKKARNAVARALTVAKNTPTPSDVDSQSKLKALVSKALNAKVAMESVADKLCKRGRK